MMSVKLKTVTMSKKIHFLVSFCDESLAAILVLQLCVSWRSAMTNAILNPLYVFADHATVICHDTKSLWLAHHVRLIC